MRKPTWDAGHAPNGQRHFFQSQTFCLRCFAKYEDANERTQVAELSWRNGRRNSQCKFSSVRWSETSNGSSDSRNLSMSTMLYLVFQLGNGGLGGQSRRRRRGLRSFNYIEGKRRRRRGLRVKQRCGEATASLPPHRNRKADKVLAHMPNMMRSRRRLFSFI